MKKPKKNAAEHAHAPPHRAEGAPAPKKASHVDADAKRKNQQRLARIEGQVRGIAAMVDDDRYCADILVQISAVQEALRGVALELLRNHLRHCATHALSGDAETHDAMVEELVDLTRRFAR